MDDFQDTDAGASEEVIFNIAHQDAQGIIHYDVLRTTLSEDRCLKKREKIKLANELYYESIGHKVVHIQMRTESAKVIKGKPRLKLIQGGLVGAVFAFSSAVSSGNAQIDDWLSDAESASEVASIERRHPARTAAKHDWLGCFGFGVRLGSMMS